MIFFKKEKLKKAVTLIEVTVVIIIIGIVAGLALPQFVKAFEATKAREAVAVLKQIRTAERTYRMEEQTYFYSDLGLLDDENKIREINSKLNLYLDVRDNRNWDYKVEVGETAESTFDATATRRSGRYFELDQNKIVFNQDGLDPVATTWPLPIPEE